MPAEISRSHPAAECYKNFSLIAANLDHLFHLLANHQTSSSCSCIRLDTTRSPASWEHSARAQRARASACFSTPARLVCYLRAGTSALQEYSTLAIPRHAEMLTSPASHKPLHAKFSRFHWAAGLW
ncbi:hypothetical protein FJTKL_05150 [Diaporthe vaccinii]|uniref:Uncharacterized protein n=1 Tax=Diaporthe vaccinii TaxID=105482 RepID=A0ABR4FEP1_9PEZI